MFFGLHWFWNFFSLPKALFKVQCWDHFEWTHLDKYVILNGQLNLFQPNVMLRICIVFLRNSHCQKIHWKRTHRFQTATNSMKFTFFYVSSKISTHYISLFIGKNQIIHIFSSKVRIFTQCCFWSWLLQSKEISSAIDKAIQDTKWYYANVTVM